MADIQHALLSKAILDGAIVNVVNARITPDFFSDDKYRRVFEFMTQHWNSYGTPPDEAVLGTAFPAMTWKTESQPIEYLIDRMRERRKKSLITEGLSEAASLLQDADNPDAVDQMELALQSALSRARLETASSFDIDVIQSRAQMEALLDQRMEDPGHLRGISTGFHGIDYVTGGLQPEQFVVLLGTPKSFKSATLLRMALAVWEQDKVPCFLGFEMSNTEQQDRLMSLISKVSLTKIMNGMMSLRERRQISKALKALDGKHPFILSSDIQSATTISGVQAKIQEYQPDVVFIDGAYLMDSEMDNTEKGSPQAITSISRGLKRLAQSQRLPIVVTTQASLVRSKGGLTIGSAMYSQAWGQDADVILGVERQGDDKDDTAEAQVKFRVIDSRSGPRKEVFLEWAWAQGHVREVEETSLDPRNQPSYRNIDDDDDDMLSPRQNG